MRTSRVHTKYIVVLEKEDYIESTKLNPKRIKNNKQTCTCKHERKLIASSSKNEKEKVIPEYEVRNLKRLAECEDSVRINYY
jgi:hypothetical protein